MGADSIWHWIIVILIVFLLFGRGKVSELMGDLASGIKAFKKAMADEDKSTSDSRQTAARSRATQSAADSTPPAAAK